MAFTIPSPGDTHMMFFHYNKQLLLWIEGRENFCSFISQQRGLKTSCEINIILLYWFCLYMYIVQFPYTTCILHPLDFYLTVVYVYMQVCTCTVHVCVFTYMHISLAQFFGLWSCLSGQPDITRLCNNYYRSAKDVTVTLVIPGAHKERSVVLCITILWYIDYLGRVMGKHQIWQVSMQVLARCDLDLPLLPLIMLCAGTASQW